MENTKDCAFTEMIRKARELAGFSSIEWWTKECVIEKNYVEKELASLINPMKAREVIAEYALTEMKKTVLKKHQTPWTNNFGDQDLINLPVILINGKPGADEYWRRERTMKFFLEHLKPTLKEEKIIRKNFGEVEEWMNEYKNNIGF